MVFLLIKFFAEIPYQWITVTHRLLQPPHFHPSLCPRRAWELLAVLGIALLLPADLMSQGSEKNFTMASRFQARFTFSRWVS
jgi:hypothetical protein